MTCAPIRSNKTLATAKLKCPCVCWAILSPKYSCPSKWPCCPATGVSRQASQGFASLLPSKRREEAEALRSMMHVNSLFQETHQGVSRDKDVSWNKIQHNWDVSISLCNPFHFLFKWTPATSNKHHRRPWTCQYQSCPSKRGGFPGARLWLWRCPPASKTDPFWKRFFQVFLWKIPDFAFTEMRIKSATCCTSHAPLTHQNTS